MRRAMALVLIMLFRSAPAQTHSSTATFTVDELVTYALTANPALQAMRARVEGAQGRLQQAGLRPNPMLDLGIQESITGPDNNLMASVTLPLDLGGRKAGRVAVAAREVEMTRAQVAEEERQLRAEVRMKAGEILSAQHTLEFIEELLRVNREAQDLLRARVARGAAPALEENLLLVEVNRLDVNRRLLRSRVEIMLLQLKTLVGLEPEAPLPLHGNLASTPLLLTLPEALSQALRARADLLVTQAEVAMAEASIAKERAEGRWDASVNVGYMRQDFGYDLQGLTERGERRPIHDVFHYAGGGVTIMLPVRNRNQGNIAAAMAEATAADRRQAFVRLRIRQEVTAAFTHYEATQRALEMYAQGVRDVARHNLAVVRKAYELGRNSLLDLIAEQRRYIDVETGYIEALKQVYDAVVDIERAVSMTAR